MSFIKIDWARLWTLDGVAFYLVELAGNGALVIDIGFFGDGVDVRGFPQPASHDQVFLLKSVL